MESLTIYILCHNRPDDARQAILSILRQTDEGFTLVVSDNSSNDEVEHLVKNEFPDINYVRRSPMLKPHEHFRRCIVEAKDDYFCLFHDDDVMSPDFVSEMKKHMHAFPDAIAIGCNANIESFGKLESHPSFRSFRKFELITSPRQLAMRYFSRSQSGIAPFPGYVYNRKIVENQKLPHEGGKYADVTWLLNLAKKGGIIWVNKPLMTYRLHASNDGNTESRRDRLSFLGYLKQNKSTLGNGILQDYRCSFIYKKVLITNDGLHLKRRSVATSFIRKYRWSRYARFASYRALAKRALVKWMTRK